MSNVLYEKFSWLKSDLVYAGPKGNKAQFKGVALLPTISGNGRRYVEEELHRSARTLIGKRVDLNHNAQKVKGDVSWAEFEEGKIEYVMEIKDTEYIEKLRDRKRLTKESYIKKWGRDPIYGVSVEANYRYHENPNRNVIEPHGIIFNALSLVEDPERPGVEGTTIELMETMQNDERRITEALVKDTVPVEHQSSVLTDKTILENTTMTSQTGDKEDCGCPPGQHKNSQGECVPDEDEDKALEILDLKHTLEKIEYKHTRENKVISDALGKTAKDLTAKIGEVDTTAKSALEKASLLEPKLDKLTETWQTKLTTEASNLVSMANEIKADIGKLKETDKTTTDSLTLLATKTELTDALAKINFEEHLKPIKEILAKLPNIEEALKPLRETQLSQEKRLQEFDTKYKTLNTVYEALGKKHADFVNETQAVQLKETQGYEDKIKSIEETHVKEMDELKAQIDTLKLHVKPSFKAKAEEKKAEPSFSPPYKY